MLQRAARNAYSWWAASHIRTKQSKWLEQNLQDMEEKVVYIFRILEEDGDSFGRRAEMYYRRRPELLNFVEDFFKSYKALAERYDYISKELQSANRTIATIYPDRVHLDMDDYNEDGAESYLAASAEKPNNSPKDLPAPPKMSIPDVVSMVNKKAKTTSRLMSKKGLVKFNHGGAGDHADAAGPTSGLSKDEALREIDELQKQILALQTEREFVKSSYENGLAKYWDIENQVTYLQARVSSLQDEFGIGTFIEDNEAQTLMASTALKSCQERLAQLQEQQVITDEDAKIEHQKVQNAQVKIQSLVEKFEASMPDRQQILQPAEKEKSPVKPSELEITTKGSSDLESLRGKIEEDLQISTSSHLTMSGLAEKVDELVDKIINLESLVVAQTAQVNRLKAEANELHAHLQTAEEEKETLLKDSEKMGKKIRELEEQLQKVNNLNQNINSQSNYIFTRITEASSRVDDLSGKLQNVLPDEGVKSVNGSGEKTDNSTIQQSNKSDVTDIQVTTNDKFKKDASVVVPPSTSQTRECIAISGVEEKQKKDGNTDHGTHQDVSTRVEKDESGTEDAEPNWRALFLNGLDERDKLLLEEYISVLRNYKESKRKLNEAEKKRRATHFQYVVQIKVLKNSIALKDAEIQSLLKKLKSLHGDQAETIKSNESTTKTGIEATDENTSKDDLDARDENKKAQHVHRRTLSELLHVPIPADAQAKSRGNVKLSIIEEYGDLKTNNVDENHAFSTIEENIRSDIDELMEENMEFWLRFSTAFRQIGKFQSSVKDLQDELQKKNPKKQQLDNKPLEQLSEIRPIYKHLREIQTELTLWLEHSVVLKDDLQHRLSSLCNLQEQITKFSQEVPKEEEKELSAFQAAKLQGEILNMKRENKRVANELQAGVKRVEKLQEEIKTSIQELDELGVKREITNSHSRIPLRSFLFGVKLKKQKQRSSLFACVSPALQKQDSH